MCDQIICPKLPINLYSYHISEEYRVALKPHPYVEFSEFFIIVTLLNVQWYTLYLNFFFAKIVNSHSVIPYEREKQRNPKVFYCFLET